MLWFHNSQVQKRLGQCTHWKPQGKLAEADCSAGEEDTGRWNSLPKIMHEILPPLSSWEL